MNTTGGALPKNFPTVAADYATVKAVTGNDCGCLTGGRCAAGGGGIFQSNATFQALNFSLPDPFNYIPSYTGNATGSNATFTALATGDLDCDATRATFQRSGGIVNGDVSGSYQPFVENELE
jgi:hypothetical protein